MLSESMATFIISILGQRQVLARATLKTDYKLFKRIKVIILK